MTPKQQRFVAEYLVTMNGTQAAINAGYSPKTAYSTANENLNKPEIKRAIAEQTAKGLAKVGLSADKTKEAIRRVIDADIRTLFDAEGNVIPIHKLSDEGAALIAGFEVVKKNLVAGDGQTDIVYKVKLKDQSRYVEMAAKHFGLLVDKLEHSGTVTMQWLSDETESESPAK